MDFTAFRTILFETYRADGTLINTPVWFVQEGDTLYFRTHPDTAKVKRLKNNPQARVAGADAAENPATPWFEVKTHFVEGEEAERVYNLLDARYSGAFKRYDAALLARGESIVVIAIELVS